MSNKYELYGEAIARAKAQVKLLEWAEKIGIETRGSYARHCPFCQGKGKFHIRETARCYSSSCSGNKAMDHIGLMRAIKGCDFRQAGDALLEYANIRNPYHS